MRPVLDTELASVPTVNSKSAAECGLSPSSLGHPPIVHQRWCKRLAPLHPVSDPTKEHGAIQLLSAAAGALNVFPLRNFLSYPAIFEKAPVKTDRLLAIGAQPD